MIGKVCKIVVNRCNCDSKENNEEVMIVIVRYLNKNGREKVGGDQG